MDGFFGEDNLIRISHKTRYVVNQCFVQTGLRMRLSTCFCSTQWLGSLGISYLWPSELN